MNPGDSQHLLKVRTPQPRTPTAHRAPRTVLCAPRIVLCAPRRSPVHVPSSTPCYCLVLLPLALVQAEDGSCTAMEYDLAKAKETRTQLLMGGCICIGVHYKFGYMQAHTHTMHACMHRAVPQPRA